LRAVRPDPARGVFTTLLAVDGRPVELDAHLRRLAASVRALWGAALDPAAAERVLAACREAAPLARVRVIVSPGVRVEVAPLHAGRVLPEAALELDAVRLAGGWGAHKWLDRDGLEPDGVEALVLDLDGEPLETTRGSLVAVEGDALVTPPADGRLLPGVTRDLLPALAVPLGLRARQAPLSLARLARADEVLVTSAVRGVQAVTRCGPLAVARGPVGAALAGALRRRWAVAALSDSPLPA
ncbi:MAG: aminotransferase class IV, partial [Actinomycetota bacterium]|nr:aminotransferase class IV [Actinomycetota bacterium]